MLIGVLGFACVTKRSFGIVIKVFVNGRRFIVASYAFLLLFSPSNENGNVTIEIVRISREEAILAAISIAPEPVPPPMPAVRNNKSES